VVNLVSERKGHQLQGVCDENNIIDTRLRLFLKCVTIFADTSFFIWILLLHLHCYSLHIGFVRNQNWSELI